LRPKQGYRLYEQRERLVERLTTEVRRNKASLLETLQYPLANRGSAQRT
jgi:hypothetical protein